MYWFVFQKEESWNSSCPFVFISSSLTPVPLWCGSSPVICSGTVPQHCEYITPPCALYTFHTIRTALIFFSYSHCFCHLLICHFIHFFLSFCLHLTWFIWTSHTSLWARWVCVWEWLVLFDHLVCMGVWFWVSSYPSLLSIWLPLLSEWRKREKQNWPNTGKTVQGRWEREREVDAGNTVA